MDAVQAWLPDPSFPPLPWIFVLAAAIAVLALFRALMLLAREEADLVAEGAIPLRSFATGDAAQTAHRDPRSRNDADGPYPLRADTAIALSVTGITRRSPCPGEALPGWDETRIKIRMPYGRDFNRAMSVIVQGCRRLDGIPDTAPPTVTIAGLADSGFELVVRIRSRAADSVAVTERLRQAVAQGLNDAGFGIPLEHIEVLPD